MKITVNGKEVELYNSDTIADFIVERKIAGTMFVIEKNLKIINKEDYASEPLQESDTIELVGFTGGG
ncbi:MAG: sulfur carrier protein ThiS [Candidatus Gastranaerophilales bacterium]|nr:sulfur carrier protein ThiS [Candidatus Gastranaerophilales bacterium]